MFSQPYDLNIYSAYTGAGVRKDKPSYQQGLFYAMYFGTGQWVRKEAGEQAVYQLEQLEVVTNMTEDTYTPVVTWTVHQVRMSSLSGPTFRSQFEVSQAKVSVISAGSLVPSTTEAPDDILNLNVSQSQSLHLQSQGSRSAAAAPALLSLLAACAVLLGLSLA